MNNNDEVKNILPGSLLAWREAVRNEAVLIGMGSINDADPRATLAAIIRWHVAVALDPRVSSAVALPMRAPGEHAAMPMDEDGGYPDWW